MDKSFNLTEFSLKKQTSSPGHRDGGVAGPELLLGALDLREFVDHLERCGELQRITAGVATDLEIARITERVSKASGPALLFTSPQPGVGAVLTNLFGSSRRTAWALGAADGDLVALVERLAVLLATAGPGSAAERLGRLCAGQSPPIAAPRWQEVVGMPQELPALRSWPDEEGFYLTLPLVVTRHPENGTLNWGLYRVQLAADGALLIHWKDGSGAAEHARAWAARGAAMPVAVVLGAPPLLLWAASAPLPPGVDEAAFAGLLAGAPLPLSSCTRFDLPVPAVAEGVIEGTVAPGDVGREGPFGNHTGGYAPAAAVPRLNVAVMHRRRDLLCPATVVGPPPMEDCYLAAATARLFLPLLRVDLPEIVDLAMPLEGIFHGCALIAANCGPGEGRELLQRLRRTALLRSSRLLILFAGGVNVHDPAAAFWVALNAVEAQRDIALCAAGIDIDATHALPHPLCPDPEIVNRVARRAGEYGLPSEWFT